MPIIHDKKKLERLLKDNGIPLNDFVKRGKFYENYFDWDSLYQMYLNGSSIRDISKKINLSYDAIRSNLKKRGELRDFTVKNKGKYTFDINELYPKTTQYGAYLMGWLYSDGSITHNRISIILQNKDFAHLLYLAGLFSNKEAIINSKGNAEFSYFGVELCEFLIKEFNLLPNKSHINFEIPLNKFKDHLPYLLLGLLEGDGSISKNNPSCFLLLSEKTWKVLYRTLKDFVDLSSIHIRKLNDYGLLSIGFIGISYFSFLLYVYGGTELVEPLERKFIRFKNQLIRSANGKTSPYKKLAVNVWDTLIHNII